MQKLIKVGIGIFLTIFAVSGALTLGGIALLWYETFSGQNTTFNLPYLPWLASIVLAEVIGVIVAFVKRGLGYLPEIKTNKNTLETNKFMQDFMAHGSTVTVVSNRLGWLADAPEVQEGIIRRAGRGVKFDIITSIDVAVAQRQALEAAGVNFYVTNDAHAPEARFTLINADRSGAERLAIARGTHPHHEITVFDSNSGPQIIGLAKDIIRNSKR